MLKSLYAEQIFGVTYDISIPTANTNTFIPNTSLLGFGLDARKLSHTGYSYGITFHWNSFKASGADQITDNSGDGISYKDRTMDAFPILVSGHYFFGESTSRFRPLIGGNIGTYFFITRQYTDQEYRMLKTWHFGLAPDIGFMAEFMRDIHILFTLRYNYAFKTSSLAAQSYFSIILGFVSVSLF
jgi:hypothetical protein